VDFVQTFGPMDGLAAKIERDFQVPGVVCICYLYDLLFE
jgi:hypothetical protein